MVKTNGDMQIVNFTVDEVNYGVPVDQVREVRDMQLVTPVPGAPEYVEGVTNLRGQIIAVIDLRKRLGLDTGTAANEKIMIIDLEKTAVGVVVDAVTEVSTIKEDDIQKNIEAMSLGEFVLGVGKQADRLSLILDIAKIVRNSKANCGTASGFQYCGFATCAMNARIHVGASSGCACERSCHKYGWAIVLVPVSGFNCDTRYGPLLCVPGSSRRRARARA